MEAPITSRDGRIRLIVDTDPAAGIFLRDIDDVLALLFLFASPEAKVEGITATYGNASLRDTYRIARRVRDAAGKFDVPVFAGASGKSDFGKATPAVEFIVDYFKENRGSAALLTLGPLTNLATALKIEPRLAEWIPAVVMMGGNLNRAMPWGPLAGFEFNFALDRNAADFVLRSPLKKWIATADLCMQTRFRYEDLTRLRRLNPASVADGLCRISQWIAINKPFLGRGFCPWDPIAAAMFVKPELFSDARPINLAMQDRGLIKSLFDAGAGACASPTVTPMKIDAVAFVDLLVSRLSTI